MPKSLHDHLHALAHERPTAPALLRCSEDGTVLEEISYQALERKVESAAQYLINLGLAKGERVALAFGNSPELLILSWAAWSCGIVTVPLDGKRDTAEMSYFKIKATGAKMVLREGEFKIPDVQTATLPWTKDLSHVALILFTSGTTAHPKGATLSLNNLMKNASGICEWLRITKDDRFLVSLPLHHINSTTFCLSTLLAGGCIALPPAYSNARFWRQAAQTRATFTSIVQTIIFDQLAREKEYTVERKNIKFNRIQVGSAPVVSHSVQEFRKKFNIPLYQGYGQTETALRVTGVPMDISAKLYDKLVEENSIGTPLSWAEVEVADEQGVVLGEGEEGELIVKGAAVMEGYIGKEPAFRNGYFLTGDIGLWRTTEGRRYFFLKGRKKEIIIKGGINISPVAVENHLKRLSPNIDQAYVIGRDDERYGEEVAAVVCWKKNVDAASAMRGIKLTLLFGTQELSAYETPKYLTACPVSELPTTSTGKVQRSVLKNRLKPGQFESLYDLIQTPRYRFTLLTPFSPFLTASHQLYNHCWQPLTVDAAAYSKQIQSQWTLLAVAGGTLAGQISFIIKDNTLTCVSICSATYKPKPIPKIHTAPTLQEVEAYLLGGYDGIYNFHHKLGAELVKIIPQGRPDDKSSLGYTMLLTYPAGAPLILAEDAPVSARLMQAILLLSHDLGVKHVDALSRPGGLAAYLARTH